MIEQAFDEPFEFLLICAAWQHLALQILNNIVAFAVATDCVRSGKEAWATLPSISRNIAKYIEEVCPRGLGKRRLIGL